MTTSPKTRLAAWDHAYLWHPFTQMQEWEQDVPLIIEQGKGPYLIDTEGRKYLDGTSSIWVNLHGHRHPRLDRALTAQLGNIAHSTLLGLSNPPAIRLARELIRLAPKGLRRVFYSDNGSTAVEVALKMAVQYWQQRHPAAGPKNSFLHLKLAYHGDTVGAVSVGNIELFHARFKSLLFPTLQVDPPYCYRCPLGLTYPACRMACIDPLEAILKTRHRELAGVILEPLVQAAAGRTGRMFACQHEGVTPDLMAISKGLTAGYMPLAATLTTEEIYRAFLGRYEDWKTFFPPASLGHVEPCRRHSSMRVHGRHRTRAGSHDTKSLPARTTHRPSGDPSLPRAGAVAPTTRQYSRAGASPLHPTSGVDQDGCNFAQGHR
ncbi:MAG: bioA [Nitrospira sp.]|nr:bioA [Nitrospira sp.]